MYPARSMRGLKGGMLGGCPVLDQAGGLAQNRQSGRPGTGHRGQPRIIATVSQCVQKRNQKENHVRRRQRQSPSGQVDKRTSGQADKRTSGRVDACVFSSPFFFVPSLFFSFFLALMRSTRAYVKMVRFGSLRAGIDYRPDPSPVGAPQQDIATDLRMSEARWQRIIGVRRG
ncbi:hypothetical protein BT67DRAFT_199500 [Trichocladium antarcticum]|uniref:Uncharacterized protein n=1 Tax=Trichocladium antarcticum TaxID=1450529 RepID=A0AAN6ZG09_9PEZI|nr:hypothetical protein BT67DRAFT_199500 [Trichocladium antarcticum]